MVIIISTPLGTVEHTDRIYEMDDPYPSALHQGLRRDIKYEPLKSSSNHTTIRLVKEGYVRSFVVLLYQDFYISVMGSMSHLL